MGDNEAASATRNHQTPPLVELIGKSEQEIFDLLDARTDAILKR